MITGSFWWSRWDSNPRPLRCESDYRQNAKYLPFQKLQPLREINGFPVLSHSLPSRIRRVLFFLATYWPFGFWQITYGAATKESLHRCAGASKLSAWGI